MKVKLSIIIMTFLYSISLMAQGKKSFIGNYEKNSEHYYIQNDSTFIIVAYATLIIGKWSIENNLLKLIPKNPDSLFFYTVIIIQLLLEQK